MEEKQYTVKEIAEHFRVSRQAIYDWINKGDLGAIRLGDRIRIPESALREFIRVVQPGERVEDRDDKGQIWAAPPALAY
jgi:excisionase family DNA binding protein